MFWDSERNGLRCVVKIGNLSLTPFDPAQVYTPDGDCLLDDPYEGELLSVFAELYGGLTPAQADAMWVMKRAKLQSTEYAPPATFRPLGRDGKPQGPLPNITVERGWWFSSHEKWKVSPCPVLPGALLYSLQTRHPRHTLRPQPLYTTYTRLWC